MFRAILILAVLATAAQAADTTMVFGPDGKQLPAGKYWSVTIHQDGTAPTVSLAFEVGGTPVVPPQPPQTDLAAQIVAEINKVPVSDKRHEVALKLSKTYEMLAGQKLPPSKAAEAVKTIVSLALGSDSGVLSGACSVVNAALGKATTEAAVSDVLKQAADAVGSTVPSAGDEAETAAKYGIDWEKFLAFLMQLLTMLLPLIIKGI